MHYLHGLLLGVVAVLTAASTLSAQVPSTDLRNTYTPHTDTRFEMPKFTSLEQWEARKRQLRRQIAFAAGLSPMPEKTPLHPQVFGKLEREGYTIEKVLLETLPGYYLGGNLYRPTGRTGKLPAVLKAHGHWSYGRLEATPLGNMQALAVNLAQHGYVVFAYDMVGYNDTIQTPHAFPGKSEVLWSFGELGLQTWNSIRALDFLESLPEVDPQRLAMTGASGGGTQTFILYALDDRIQWAAPVNMISSIMQGGCVCENAAGLRVAAHNMEIGAMFAPKPLLMVSATGDWTRNTPQVEFPAIQSIYALYGKPDAVETVLIDAPHNYNRESREAMYRFFGKHVLGDANAGSYTERNSRTEQPQDLLALHNRALPEGAVTYEQLFARWREMSTAQVRAMKNHATLREHLSGAMGVSWPGKVVSQPQQPVRAGGNIVLSRAGAGDRISGWWSPGRGGAPVLVITANGADAARSHPRVKQLLQARRRVLAIDVFQTGSAQAPRERSHRHFLTFNLSDDANRVQDVVTALAYLNGHASIATSAPVEVVGLDDRAALWALFGAAIAPIPVRVQSNLEGFSGADADYLEKLNIPGIQRGGGLEAALRLVWRPE
jgi:dienelactone hydrolase